MPHLHPAALNLFFLWLGFLGGWKRVPDRKGWEMCDCSYGFMLNRRVHLLQRAWCTSITKLPLPKSSARVEALVYIFTAPVSTTYLWKAIQLFSALPDLIPWENILHSRKFKFIWLMLGFCLSVYFIWVENSKVTVFFSCIFTLKISFCPCSIYNCLRRIIYLMAAEFRIIHALIIIKRYPDDCLITLKSFIIIKIIILIWSQMQDT